MDVKLRGNGCKKKTCSPLISLLDVFADPKNTSPAGKC